MALLPTPWPADPVEGEPGHFDHTLWVKAGLIALDNGKLDKPASPVPAGRIMATTAPDVWGPVLPTAVGGVPAGVIVAFHGSVIPSGWAVCNGSNGTPNLQDRFIIGASNSRAAGSSGGESSVTLTAAQSGVPAHTHTTASADAAHSHSLTETNLQHSHGMGDAGGHYHGVNVYQASRYGAAGSWNYDLVATAGGTPYGSTDTAGAHSHGIHNALGLHGHTVQSASAPHSHTVNANTAANAAQPHNNMPPYYALVYIMKL
jgi:microcystin-dependent protein